MYKSWEEKNKEKYSQEVFDEEPLNESLGVHVFHIDQLETCSFNI